MQKIFDVMTVYRYCLDEDLKPISFDSLLNNEAMHSFKSYVFTDTL